MFVFVIFSGAYQAGGQGGQCPGVMRVRWGGGAHYFLVHGPPEGLATSVHFLQFLN